MIILHMTKLPLTQHCFATFVPNFQDNMPTFYSYHTQNNACKLFVFAFCPHCFLEGAHDGMTNLSCFLATLDRVRPC